MDLNEYSNYLGNGLCLQIKKKINVKFRPLGYFYEEGDIDLNSHNMHEFDSGYNNTIIHCCFLALEEYQLNNRNFKSYWNFSDYKDDFLPIFLEKYAKTTMHNNHPKDFSEAIPKVFFYTASAVWPPLAAFAGGVVAQEIIKAITHKFNPIHQFYYAECKELASDLINKPNVDFPKPQNDRYDNLRICVGEAFAKKLWNAKIFMIGAGAIGCELMKNYAMLGVGRSGKQKNKKS